VGIDYPAMDDFCRRLRGHPGIATLPYTNQRMDTSELVKLSLTFVNGALFFAGYWFITMSVFWGPMLVGLRRYRHQIG